MPITMDTQQQNFWVESIQKEAALRFAWQLRYSKKFAKENSSKREPQKKDSPAVAGKSFKQNITDQINQIESSMTGRTNRVIGPPVGSRPRTSTTSRKGPIRDMRPATVNTKSLLYSGISAHGEGRYAYLKKRKLLTPEEKFEFPVLSSCQYGWKILEYVKNPKGSKFARTCVIKDTFYRNSGISLG